MNASTAQTTYTCICPRQYANSCFNKADGSSKPKKRRQSITKSCMGLKDEETLKRSSIVNSQCLSNHKNHFYGK